ncbi:MAG: hypothetical protein E7462_06315 [Ruminococcaceae bacterium]|nr:hypothetical protein [Oscillospiraceae bacterium]
MPEIPKEIPMEELLKFASTPQGQALLSQLQQKHGQELEAAMAQAQAGNYDQVKQMVSDFLKSPSGKLIMMQFRGRFNG